MSLISKEEETRFKTVCGEIRDLNQEPRGIGTLKEKTVHAVVKRFIEPDEDCHEIPVDGFVADIYRNEKIIEIQTGNFNRLRKKLDCFLKKYDVTVVYPIPRQKYLRWLDPETGELSEPRKSPKKGNPYQAFKELYRIRNYLGNEKLHFMLLIMDVEEIRLLNGWSLNRKKGSERYDRYPLQLVEIVDIRQREDFYQLVPADLQDTFTAKEYARAAGVSGRIAGTAVLLLRELGILNIVEKKGKAYIYQVVE